MSSESSKTEKPTPKKIRDARKEGNVAYSRDLSMFIAISIFLISITLGYKLWVRLIGNNYLFIFKLIKEQKINDNYSLISALLELLTHSLLPILIVIVIAALVTALSSIIQLGGLLITNKLSKIDFKKFNPIENAKQIFAKKNLLKFAFNCFKLTIMSIVASYIVKINLNQILILNNLQFYSMLSFCAYLILKIFLTLLAIYLIFALVDFIIEKRANYKQLMMSMEEIKKEYKETEGNPEIKGMRKELHREILAEDNMFGLYKDSMLVLANPTHIACVILYLPQKWKLPILVYKAKGVLAHEVFQIARKYKIPIIRNKWLARNMYEIAEVNKEVPPSLTKDMANFIAKNIHLRPVILENIRLMQTSSLKK